MRLDVYVFGAAALVEPIVGSPLRWYHLGEKDFIGSYS